MKTVFVWGTRALIVLILIPGLVAATSGNALYHMMADVAWPITEYVHLMPSLGTWDGEKWIYAALTVVIEFILVAGIVLLLAELMGKPRLSTPSMRSIAYLLAQVELGVRNAWNLQPHECRFYWLAADKKHEYEYFTSHQHLNDLDERVVKHAFLLGQDLKAERNLQKDFPRHPAHQFIFLRNSGKFRVGIIVFINKPNILTNASVNAFMEIVEPIISLDGTKEIMVELTKKRGEIVV